ncbi:MAG: hypothetical protein V4857_15465 [Pseudomonadota bacterium]
MRIRTAVPLLLLAIAASAAQAEVVMIVSARTGQAPPVEQVCQVFLGKLKTPLPINLMDKNPTRDEFYSKACKKDPAQVRAIWGKLIFTGTGTPPREVDSGEAMRKAVAADPASVGYLDKKDVDASVRIIATFN